MHPLKTVTRHTIQNDILPVTGPKSRITLERRISLTSNTGDLSLKSKPLSSFKKKNTRKKKLQPVVEIPLQKWKGKAPIRSGQSSTNFDQIDQFEVTAITFTEPEDMDWEI